jgi:hypothetical protein
VDTPGEFKLPEDDRMEGVQRATHRNIFTTRHPSAGFGSGTRYNWLVREAGIENHGGYCFTEISTAETSPLNHPAIVYCLHTPRGEGGDVCGIGLSRERRGMYVCGIGLSRERRLDGCVRSRGFTGAGMVFVCGV